MPQALMKFQYLFGPAYTKSPGDPSQQPTWSHIHGQWDQAPINLQKNLWGTPELPAAVEEGLQQ